MNAITRKLSVGIASTFAALLLSAGVASAAGTPNTTNATNLNPVCKSATAPVSVLRHQAGGGYWGHVELQCTINYKAELQYKVNGNVFYRTQLVTTGLPSNPAGYRITWDAARFSPAQGAGYQVVVVVTATNGASLGYSTSNTPIVLKT